MSKTSSIRQTNSAFASGGMHHSRFCQGFNSFFLIPETKLREKCSRRSPWQLTDPTRALASSDSFPQEAWNNRSQPNKLLHHPLFFVVWFWNVFFVTTRLPILLPQTSCEHGLSFFHSHQTVSQALVCF